MGKNEFKKATYRPSNSAEVKEMVKAEPDPTTRGLGDFLRTLCEEIDYLGNITSNQESAVNRLREYEMDSSLYQKESSGDTPSQGIINDLWSARQKLVNIRRRLSNAQEALSDYVNN